VAQEYGSLPPAGEDEDDGEDILVQHSTARARTLDYSSYRKLNARLRRRRHRSGIGSVVLCVGSRPPTATSPCPAGERM